MRSLARSVSDGMDGSECAGTAAFAGDAMLSVAAAALPFRNDRLLSDRNQFKAEYSDGFSIIVKVYVSHPFGCTQSRL
jgi:hypothetical protein